MAHQPQFHMRLKPTPVVCPNCNSHVTTKVEYTYSRKTHTCALLLCVIGMWYFVCLLYICFTKVEHFCQYCGACLTQYKN